MIRIHFTECTNSFVQVEYEETSSVSTISCTFVNVSDTSEKTCCVSHRLCDQNQPDNTPGPVCSIDSPYSIQLEVSRHLTQTYCYTVTASNDTYTINVEGTFILGIIIIISAYCHYITC